MEKDMVSDKQGISIITLFFIGSSLIMGIASEAKIDNWIATLLGILISFPILFLYGRILYVFPEKNIFDILPLILGKTIGRVLSLLYIWYFFHLGAIILRDFGEFMNTIVFPETPLLVTLLSLSLICIWACKYGIKVIGRTSRPLLIICIGMLTIIQFMAIPKMKLSNLKPILGNGFLPVINGAFSAFSFPFGESIVLTGVLSSLTKKNSIYRIFFSSLILGGLVLIIVQIRNTALLGSHSIFNLYYPSYVAASRIKIGDFFERVESTSIMVLVSSVFIKISVCLLSASNGIKKILSIKSYKSVVLHLGLLMTYLAYFLYSSTMEMQEWTINIYRIYAIPFEIILPIITVIVMEIKLRNGLLKEAAN